MELSVIVPIYNVEAYLESCLESILRQGVADCEIILVDDASPDRCGEICDAWARRDNRFLVVHRRENGGLSAARNSGLEVARGDYVTFVDSDDDLAPRTWADNLALLRAHPELGVVEFPVRVLQGASEAFRYAPSAVGTTDFASWVRQKGYLHCYAWNKIYKRELWASRRFPEGRLFEDIFTIPYVLEESGKFLCSDKGLYYYRTRKGSISQTVCTKGLDDLLEANLQLYQSLLCDTVLPDAVLDEFYLRMCDTQIVKLQYGGAMSVPDRVIPLGRAFSTPYAWNYRLKAIMKALAGTAYCQVFALLRKILMK